MKTAHMIRLLLFSLTLILCIFQPLKAQNLILNGDFETGGRVQEASRSISLGRAQNWSDGSQSWAVSGNCNVIESGSCDLFDQDAPSAGGISIQSGVPSNSRTFNTPDPAGKKRYAGMYLQKFTCGSTTQYGESLVGTVSTVSSGTYKFTCWVKLFDKPTTGTTTVRIPSDYVKLQIRLFNNSTGASKIILNTNEIYGTQEWVGIATCFTMDEQDAASNFNRIEIRGIDVTRINPSFPSIGLKDDYIFIDEVSLTKCVMSNTISLPSTACIQDPIILKSLVPTTGFYNIQIKNLNTGLTTQNNFAFQEPGEVFGNPTFDITYFFPELSINTCYEVTLNKINPDECCPFEFTQNICIKDCDLCDNSVNINYEIDCHTVNFNNTNNFAPLLASYWKFFKVINPDQDVYLGKSTQTNPSFTFPGPGKYKACLYVTGLTESGKPCCKEECATFDIPASQQLESIVNLCDNESKEFDLPPCSGRYEVLIEKQNGTTMLVSALSNKIMISPDIKKITVTCVNENGCISYSMTINVQLNQTTVIDEFIEEYIPCNSTTFDMQRLDHLNIDPEIGWERIENGTPYPVNTRFVPFNHKLRLSAYSVTQNCTTIRYHVTVFRIEGTGNVAIINAQENENGSINIGSVLQPCSGPIYRYDPVTCHNAVHKAP